MARGSTLVAAAALTIALASASGKRGLAYNSAELANLFAGYDEVTWAYNWGLDSSGLDSQFDFVPMLWGDPTGNEGWIEAWQAAVQTAISSGSNHVIGFNEPDLNGLSPAQAAAAWQKYVQPYAGKVKLGAPAVTNGGAPLGLTWLSQFMTACSNCTIDFVPFHWYCGYDLIEYFTEYIEEVYAAVDRPIWLTEFQGQTSYCTTSATDVQQAAFLSTVLPWMDSTPYLQRYSYFGVFESTSTQKFLINMNGTGLTKTGRTYATLDTVNATLPDSLVTTPKASTSKATTSKTTTAKTTTSKTTTLKTTTATSKTTTATSKTTTTTPKTTKATSKTTTTTAKATAKKTKASS